ncbi:MAG: DUF4435 domain-containing protein [Chloroflexi bacterium]|nr:DUF4435 domain-containing protein [Chloroflexota bacterium]
MLPEMTAQEIANEIGVRQIQSRIYGEGETFVMVEGKTDEVLWEEFRSREDCTLYPAQGKDRIIAALGVTKKRGMQGVAGIVDADYWLITEADELGTKNLLYDDCCPDMESMLLCSPALKKVLRNNLYNYDVDEMHQFAEKLTREAQRLAVEFGYFRLLNHLMNDYDLRCNTIRFEEVIDSDTLELDCEWVARRLAEDLSDITGEQLLRQVSELRTQYPPDNPQLCRGKDIVEILAYLLPLRFKAEFGEDLPQGLTAAFQGRALSISLRSAYDSAYFKGTSLFHCIRKWECANEPYRILKARI